MGENNILKLIEYYMLLFMYVLKSTVLQPFVEWIDTRIEMNPTLVHSLEQVNAGMVHVNESDDDYADSEVDMRDDYLRENVDDMMIESSSVWWSTCSSFILASSVMRRREALEDSLAVDRFDEGVRTVSKPAMPPAFFIS